jgi:hypothetical protein
VLAPVLQLSHGWLFGVYSRRRVQRFLREHGERWLQPATFNYWRKLLGVRRWQPAPFGKGYIIFL